ncbi:hypothetical protein PUNSTDRAFT_77752 [Punctularia strigosozonata HHB-11173 SS5]|uniref:Uncharacterized protein n=1 Tax=Punctularia strigosozonata (strain HHB-11173) TaxID=741275 RepID=R7S179_PUNST|nr:uncharacterized protein PUNSTDRAFT_77752 [Punctularia strigosozonata HHB-11173 SS5]EIN03599.1 hypothetical protein PUNSTDRAFT_77752 [Punctularia strigosozonata HHB-11173 SS5]
MVPTKLAPVFHELSKTSAAYLLSNSPLTSDRPHPTIDPVTISPVKPKHADLLTKSPETEREALLQHALHKSEVNAAYLKGQLLGQQAGMVLQSLYCERVRRQLATQEKKEDKAGKKKRIMGDGMPKLLTSDEFVQLVIDHEEAELETERTKARRRKLAEKRAKLMEKWKEDEKARLERNKAQRQRFKDEMEAYEVEKANAKAEKRKLHLCKPKLGKVEAQAPKPKISETTDDDSEQESDETELEESADETD